MYIAQYYNLHLKSHKLMGILWVHMGAIGCISHDEDRLYTT